MLFQVKSAAKTNFYRAAAELVEDAMLDVNDDDDQPPASRLVAANLVRYDNRLHKTCALRSHAILTLRYDIFHVILYIILLLTHFFDAINISSDCVK